MGRDTPVVHVLDDHDGVLTVELAKLVLLLSEHDAPRVVQAWFQGLNPHLEDRSPARLLRDGDLDEVGPLVLAAARAFLVGG